jgi:hypothetical protein
MMGIRVVVTKEIVTTPTTEIAIDQLVGVPIEERTQGETITIVQVTATEDTAFKVNMEEVFAERTINQSRQDRRVTKNMDATGSLTIATANPASMETPIAIVKLTSAEKRLIVREKDEKRKRSVDGIRFEHWTSWKKRAVGERKSECATLKCPKRR